MWKAAAFVTALVIVLSADGVRSATFSEIVNGTTIPLSTFKGYYEGPIFENEGTPQVVPGCFAVNSLGPYYFYTFNSGPCPIIPSQQVLYSGNYSLPGVRDLNAPLASIKSDEKTIFKCLNATTGYFFDFPSNLGSAYCSRFVTSDNGNKIAVTASAVQSSTSGECPAKNVFTAADLLAANYDSYYTLTAGLGALPFRCQ